MTSIYDLEKENGTIFCNTNLKKNDELMTIALYHILLNLILYSHCETDEIEKINFIHKTLKDTLAKYSQEKIDTELDFKNFILGFLKKFDNNCPFINEINEFASNIDIIINDLSWVNKINNKMLSFESKANIVEIVNNILIKANYLYEDIIRDEKVESVKKGLETTIISFAIGIEYDNFSKEKFINMIKRLCKDYTKIKLNEKEIELNNSNYIITTAYNSLDETGKKILSNILIPHIIADLKITDMEKEIKEEFGFSNIKTQIELYTFKKKWKKIKQQIIDREVKKKVLERKK